MKRGIILAALVIFAAATAGCSLQAAIPAFLLHIGVTAQTQAPAASPSATPQATSAPTPKPTPSPMPTPVATKPAASPTPATTAAPSTTAEPYQVITRYQSTMPVGLPVALQYSKYTTPLDYFVALKAGWAYASPDTNSKRLKSFSDGSRYRLDMLVLAPGGASKWYHVLWTVGKTTYGGYVKQSAGAARSFRLSMMLDHAKQLKTNTDTPNTIFIVNYKNRNGLPPKLAGGKMVDPFGNRQDQSAPAYVDPTTKSAFRYVPDGMLGTKLAQSGGLTKIYFPSFGETRWVPDKYISKTSDAIGTLKQVVVVDRQNQNAAVFTNDNGAWKLIAMTFVSTGKAGGYYVKTPLGSFMAQERVSKFWFYHDGTTKIEGYAPYAIRFSGGGYLHGVPRDLKKSKTGKMTDPGIAESLHTLGTTPQSHMCIRNYTSFAKFLFDWYKKGECAVIVFE